MEEEQITSKSTVKILRILHGKNLVIYCKWVSEIKEKEY